VFFVHVGLKSSAFHLTGLGALYELVLWWKSGMEDDENFISDKITEAFLEAGPFLLLQIYVVITEDDYNWFPIISLVATCLSVGYAAA